jgi:hypothetical protein
MAEGPAAACRLPRGVNYLLHAVILLLPEGDPFIGRETVTAPFPDYFTKCAGRIFPDCNPEKLALCISRTAGINSASI